MKLASALLIAALVAAASADTPAVERLTQASPVRPSVRVAHVRSLPSAA
jgi:hypothetical protein